MIDPKYEDVISFEALLAAANECQKDVMWKASAQMYAANKLRWISGLHNDLANGTYRSKGFNTFTLCDRGKVRKIQAVHISERTVQKSLVANALKPIILPRLIYDNSATLKGKGTEFAINRLKQHLTKHYHKHGRTGGILTIDYSNYFGSINHKKLLKMMQPLIADKRIYDLYAMFVNNFDGDVGLGLGSEISQTSALFYPNAIDHYIKEQLHIIGYGRYMDDSYLIHEDLDYLKYCLDVIRDKCAGIDLQLNTKHTRITKFDSGHFEYLKKRIGISNSGKIVTRLARKNITRRRQLLRKHKIMYDAGLIDIAGVYQSYQSWRGYAEKYYCYRTVQNMNDLYCELFKEV